MTKKKQALSREQAMQLYDDLEKAMSSIVGKKGGVAPTTSQKNAAAIRSAMAKRQQINARPVEDDLLGKISSVQNFNLNHKVPNGRVMAISVIVLFSVLKLGTAFLDASGVFKVDEARASIAMQAAPVFTQTTERFSKEEVKLLTALDERRSQLEERSKKLDDREHQIELRDQEFAARLTQIRELTNALKSDREKGDKKRSGQLEQLANVYGSMDPKEAAALIEQLDMTISLALLQKMPEKRIAQILALMSPEKALNITKMISGKAE